MDRVTFEAVDFKVNTEARTLTGLLLPFNEVSGLARDSLGALSRYHFAPGTVSLPPEGAPVILNIEHDEETLAAQIGVATDLKITDAGVAATFKIARTPEGDRVLALADAGILRKFSAEITGGVYDERDGVRYGQEHSPTVVSGGAVVLRPAFAGADITSVAASAAQNKESNMECTKCGKVHAAGVTACEAAASFSADDRANMAKLMADVEANTAALAELKDLKLPVGPGTAQFQVTEEPIYRFSGTTPAPSGFDFGHDLYLAAMKGDQAAMDRVAKYSAQRVHEARFADQPTTTGDTAALNPQQYRPDLFLGQAPTPRSPLFDFFFKGVRNDVTPFYWSKLDRTNTDIGVADHTEGTEPESRDLVTATVTPVTPVPVSGKVHITREVGDQGGNPALSGLIRSEFDRSYSIACETKTAALVLASSAAELGAAITAGETDYAAIGDIVEDGLINLQFLADGFRFEKAFGHIDLYKALSKAKDDNGRKLYPILNPQNASGQASSKYASLDIAGWGMTPAASLGATDTNKKSYLADPFAVHVWASGLNRLDKLKEDVEGWDIGVFGYFAGVVYDSTGLRKITYDPTA